MRMPGKSDVRVRFSGDGVEGELVGIVPGNESVA